jgi:large repetitive protein
MFLQTNLFGAVLSGPDACKGVSSTRSQKPRAGSRVMIPRVRARCVPRIPNRLARRRGVVLILVLAMLGLLALVGITFVALSSQARISGRHFALSVTRPKSSDLMWFALSQLIQDTSNPMSAIRGHSLLRDMYGNDASTNGSLVVYPGGRSAGPSLDPRFYVLAAEFDMSSRLWRLRTNIGARDPILYGYNFTRWIMRFRDSGGSFPRAVDQTCEILVDDDSGSAFGQGYRVFSVSDPDTMTVLNNPTLGIATPLVAPFNSRDGGPNPRASFVLDGRFLRAFNGPGLGQTAVYGNFRVNGGLLEGNSDIVAVGNPDGVGMDEDYDACDLENWFLAIQSADGQVVVPSFHRPGIIRADPTDASYPNNPSGPSTSNDWRNTSAESAARFLRPRSVDGHDPVSFPDLVPDLVTGKVRFDVDNDCDGETDSVWLDLGYAARVDSHGVLCKPLYSFLVLGLNGRIPLNSAGNLADVSDPSIGPRHAAHLGNSVSEVDPTYALQNAPDPTELRFSQTDNAGIDVRLTQLRNLLTGTRPQVDPFAPTINAQNGDANWVLIDGVRYYLPNNVADEADVPVAFNPGHVLRNTPSVPGRWGEGDRIPGAAVNPITADYGNLIRAGRSVGGFDPDSNRAVVRDHDDDNSNAFDFFPAGPGRSGEVGDADLYDDSGALLLPVEWMRRFVTPVDVDGSGQVVRWNQWDNTLGPDRFGRIGFLNYFRPPGSPGIVSPDGTITQRAAGSAADDLTNNLFHGFESLRIPRVTFGTPRHYGGAPFNVGNGMVIPTYDTNVNSQAASPALNEADEQNSAEPDFGDSLYNFPDLEWLYRQQDQDVVSIVSRLAKLAPVSFTNPVDGLRRRRLFSLGSWEQTTYVWANDNPGNTFSNNSRFRPGANASFANLNVTTDDIVALPSYPWSRFNSNGVPTNPQLSIAPNPLPGWPVPTPSLAHRDRKINLNFPLPVSNRPDEPIRVKWIRDTYELLKAVLPPKAVDTPLELAQLSQFVINVVDYRDCDATMTQFVNPDVSSNPVTAEPGSAPSSFHPPFLAFADPPGSGDLRQFGMEYTPVAINEVLSYSNRLMIEIVNTLTEASAASTASQLDLTGWKMVVLPDDPRGRPDPVTGMIPTLRFDVSVTLPDRTIEVLPVPIGGGDEGSGLRVPLVPLRTTAAGADGDGRYYYVIGNASRSSSTENSPTPMPDCVLPDAGSAAGNEQVLMDQLPRSSDADRYFWLYLLRPANPFDFNSPLIAVDSVRFVCTRGTNPLYSVQRLQPMRGGQLIPAAPGASDYAPADAYGFSEQLSTPPPSISHTLGMRNSPAETDWDYVPFLDRDFTSLAELLLVPRCAPGLFTKRFAEQAPPLPLPPSGAPFVTPPSVRPAPLRVVLDTIPQTYPYLADEFFYTGASESAVPLGNLPPTENGAYVGGPSGAGWHKMLEFLEVPSRGRGSTGRVSQGMNFDTARSDRRPGLLNLNLVIDEEVFLSLMGRQPLNFQRASLHGDYLPRVVTMVNSAGTPVATYPVADQGFFAADPSLGGSMNAHLKAAFVEFLRVRHGGSGYLFAFGSGAVGTPNRAANPRNHLQVAAERPFRSLSFPDINATVLRPAALPPSPYSSPPATALPLPASQPSPFVWDSGLKNPYLAFSAPSQPPPIPARRLFQVPDHYTGISPSNASEGGDPFVNMQTVDGNLGDLTGARVNLVAVPAIQDAYLGSGPTPDRRQCPYFRTEWLQSIMNLTTVRSHQFAVWITIGFFEVTRAGRPELARSQPSLACDLLGTELTSTQGRHVRHRAFFVLDRSRASGFNSSGTNSIHDVIVYQKFIQ